MSTFTNEQFESEAGAVVLESAILKFLSSSDPATREQFATFIETNEKSPTLIDDLGSQFPRFTKLLKDELGGLKADASSLADE
jgi:hypothetical protein